MEVRINFANANRITNDLNSTTEEMTNTLYRISKIAFDADHSFFIVGKRIILTNGFIKKQDQTPESEKARARSYRDDYFRRYGK